MPFCLIPVTTHFLSLIFKMLDHPIFLLHKYLYIALSSNDLLSIITFRWTLRAYLKFHYYFPCIPSIVSTGPLGDLATLLHVTTVATLSSKLISQTYFIFQILPLYSLISFVPIP